MSTQAEAILDQFKSLPPEEQRNVWGRLQEWIAAAPKTPRAEDPIRTARGMFAGSRLTEALLASRAEDRRRG
jgi:hypothetical protein